MVAAKKTVRLKAAKEKNPVGHPTTFTEAMGDRICDLMMSPMSLTKACEQPGIPSRQQVCRWLLVHEGFRTKYREAMDVRIDLMVDETVDIADDVAPEAGEISRGKLRIDSRWRMAERMAARKYGLKQQIEQTTVPHEQWLDLLK